MIVYIIFIYIIVFIVHNFFSMSKPAIYFRVTRSIIYIFTFRCQILILKVSSQTMHLKFLYFFFFLCMLEPAIYILFAKSSTKVTAISNKILMLSLLYRSLIRFCSLRPFHKIQIWTFFQLKCFLCSSTFSMFCQPQYKLKLHLGWVGFIFS